MTYCFIGFIYDMVKQNKTITIGMMVVVSFLHYSLHNKVMVNKYRAYDKKGRISNKICHLLS